MIYIDDLVIELVMPEIIINYLNNQNIFDVFNINDTNYILKDNVSELDKNKVLNIILHLISSEVGQYTLDNEEYLEEFNKIGASIFYLDHYAKHLVENGKIEIANLRLKNKIKEIYDFKLKLTNKSISL